MSLDNFFIDKDLISIYEKLGALETEKYLKQKKWAKKENEKYNKYKNVNKKEYLKKDIENLKELLESILILLGEAIYIYKKLYHKTEYWEKKSTFDFNFEDWQKIKKVNGRITKYYNDIMSIRKKIGE